ncbi:MAG: TVP38/TMEM64 family protein [Clostridia bacterium]|nr:TVP38/TMEM64 family protein [Clostridia bacterium]
MSKFTKRELAGIFIRCGIAMIIFILAILNYDRLSTIDVAKLASVSDNNGIQSAIVLLVYALKSVVFVIPASLVYVAVGGMFSHAWAITLNLTGILIELTLTYFLGKLLGRKTVVTILSKSEKGKKLLKKELGTKPGLIFGIRAVPAFPIDFVSLLYGVSGCGFLKYLLFSFLGVSWRVILFTILGNDIFKFIPMDKIILIVICLIPVGVIAYLLKKFVLDKKREGQSNETEA